ncbi:MAG: hypothetical protein AUJ98_06760 [Bacteroidetes bacterium CG2_30_33_31]|nr:MAG: hypothetical protein AUJ98_06760 [Bacteroidetes bacterium CG2_30_33_31]
MKTPFFLNIILLTFLTTNVIGQKDYTIKKQLFISGDSLLLDSFSIVPQSFVMLDTLENIISDSLYHVDYATSYIYFSNGLAKQNVIINYKTFSYDFDKVHYHKKNSSPIDSDQNLISSYTYSYSPKKMTDVFGLNEFQKSGNISRGISVGNSQNLSVASDMNIQLSGKITSDLMLTAAINDNNIPIQADGNTQQLQDFDNVFIKLEHKNGSLTAGDIILKKPNSYFLNYNKKSQGALAETNFNVGSNESKMRIYAGFGIAKGKYNRFKFQGVEANQGPYRLQGANFERYIVVLSGSEKVFMDGKPLIRGESNDYVINYNTAEVIFMPKVIVTKDKRFEVEFEYSEVYYSRALIVSGVDFNSKKLHISSNIFSEGDLKNQPIDMQFTNSQKNFLENIGDSIQNAAWPSIDSTGFIASRIMYKMVDSLTYDSVFVYSTNPDSAVYQLSFSLLGLGKGNYILENSIANGRVFRWVAPLGSILQGSYEPMVLLVTPKKKQMITTSVGYKLAKHTEISSEIAASINDINTFSSFDSQDDAAVAVKFGISNEKIIGKKLVSPFVMKTTANYEFIQANFSPIERYRVVEFDRDWNGLSEAQKVDEHLTSVSIVFNKKDLGSVNYKFSNYLKGANNHGNMSNYVVNINKKGWNFIANLSNTSTNQTKFITSFMRHNIEVGKIIRNFKIGLKENAEKDIFSLADNTNMLPNSFSFNEYGAFLTSADTSKTFFKLEYKRRNESKSDSNRLALASASDDIYGEIALLKNPKNSLKIFVSYRQLSILDSSLSLTKPDESARGRIEHQLKLWNGSIRANSFYESSSGLEIKKEYTYLQVAAGQGVYSWNDYNTNGIQELDEFELAAFQDQANYIRIIIPSSEYVKTLGSRFNTSINFTPSLIWAKSNVNILKTIALFSDNLVFRTQYQTQNGDLLEAINPFLNKVLDPNLTSVNSFFRNSFYFNRNSPVFGAEWNFVYNKNKILMLNGYEGSENKKNGINLKWSISRDYLIEIIGEQGKKLSYSEFFDSRNFNIDFKNITPKITFQPGRIYRISLLYAFAQKTNHNTTQNNQIAVNNSLTISGKYSMPKKGNIIATASYIEWKYNSKDKNQLYFEMLEGFEKGVNLRWNISYNRSLMDNLQLTFTYDGRKAVGSAIINTGTIQLRAYF